MSCIDFQKCAGRSHFRSTLTWKKFERFNRKTERVKYLIFHNTNWNFKPRLAFDGTAHIRTCMNGIMCLCFLFSSLAVAIPLQQIQTTKHIQHIQNNESNKLFGGSKDRTKLLKKYLQKAKIWKPINQKQTELSDFNKYLDFHIFCDKRKKNRNWNIPSKIHLRCTALDFLFILSIWSYCARQIPN